MYFKMAMLFSILGMLAALGFCISVENSTWFIVGFAAFLGNMSFFYLTLKANQNRS